MLQFMYTGVFIYSVICLIVLVTYFSNRISVYYVLLFSSIVVVNFGYMQMTCAKEELVSIYCNQTIYLGGSFCPFFMILCFCDLCKVKANKIFKYALLCIALISFGLVSTVGVVPWYYKHVSVIERFGINMLLKDYGPLHTLYPMYLMATVITDFVVIIKSFKKGRDVSYITGILLAIANTFSVVSYILEKLTGLDIPLLPFGYFVSETLVLCLIIRISKYDIASISSAYLADSKSSGFLLCDSLGLFLGSDDTAKGWFPELASLKIDLPIKNDTTDFIVQIRKWLCGEDKSDSALIERNGRIYEVKHYILTEKKRKSIHCFSIRDDTEQQKYMKLVEGYNEELESAVSLKTEKIREIQNDIIISMASIVENRDNNTGGHIARTSDVVKIFVSHLIETGCCPELTKEFSERIIKAAPLHDFGKIGIPDVILNKPGKFTDEEYEIMKQHSAKGAVIVERILQNSDDELFKKIAVNVAHFHHEKWNGQGYPERISAEAIPIEARVMALADVFDALVSKRVYKESFDYDRAFTIIEESGGSHFDPKLCREFLACRNRLEELYDSYTD